MNLRKDIWLMMTLLTVFPAVVLSVLAVAQLASELDPKDEQDASPFRSQRIQIVTSRGGFATAGLFAAGAAFCYWRYARQLTPKP